MVSCSGKDKSKTEKKSLSDQIVDTLGTVLARGFAESVQVKSAVSVESVDTEKGIDAMEMIAEISDIELTDSKLYAAFDGGRLLLVARILVREARVTVGLGLFRSRPSTRQPVGMVFRGDGAPTLDCLW